MQSQITNLPKSMVKITIEITPEEFDKYREQAMAELTKELKLPGFRPGHVPKDLAESQLGNELIKGHTLEKAIPHSYAGVVLKEKIPVVSKPRVTIVSETPLKYEVEVSVLPDVKLKKDPKTLKISLEKVTVTEKEEEEVLANIKKNYATFTDTKEPAKVGDRVEINFNGVDEQNVPLEGTESKNHPVIIGGHTLLPDFEKNLVGLKTGENKEFDLTFPADYHHKKFQNKKVHFKINVIRIQNVNLPEITEEWLETSFGKKQTIAEFKQILKENIAKEKEQEAKNKRDDQFLEELIKLADFELPESLIEEEIDFMIEETKMNLKQRGLPEDQSEKFLKESGEKIRKNYRETAEKHVLLRLILQHLFKENKIAVSEEDLKQEIDLIVSAYPEKRKEEVKEHYADHQESRTKIINRLKLEKLFKIYLPE